MEERRTLIIVCLVTLLLVLRPAWGAQAATITVTTANDVLDAAADCVSVTLASLPGPDGFVSLREALCAANNNIGPDTINFNIPGAGVHTIDLASALPQVADDDTTIDGYTQLGALPATDTTPATILIQIEGLGVLHNGFNITSSGNLIRGLAIYGFVGSGVWIANYAGSIANDNLITGNYLGTTASGTLCVGNGLDGVFIGAGAQNNRIGGDNPADRNLISCNGWEGVGIHGSGTTGNIVSGNYIGTDASGTMSLPNIFDGVRIYGGAQDNVVGGDMSGEGNLISGNTRNGVRIMDTDTTGNIVMGNYIGLEPDGANQRSNGDYGVFIGKGARNNLIGGDAPGERNLISGNLEGGVLISDTLTTNNTVSGNYIGTDASGQTALPNYGKGVMVDSSPNNQIGGNTPGARNLISGNADNGIMIWSPSATGNIISGNYIGTDADGQTALLNQEKGVLILSSPNNRIGGDTPEERNLISGNGDDGIVISGPSATGNLVSGNYIGTDASGQTALPNADNGVVVTSSGNNQIGGDTPGERNLISGNGDNGIVIAIPPANGNVVSGNYVGVGADGLTALPNQGNGVVIQSVASNQIGGDTPDERNVISANLADGVRIVNPPATSNIVSGNYIGVGADGLTALPNGSDGVDIDIGAHDNVIGGSTAGERNIISGNANGVKIGGDDPSESTSDNLVQGNFIGLGSDGLTALGNDRDGIHITVNSPDNTIGPGNRIAYNGGDGIQVDTPLTVGNAITENSIFSNTDLGINLSNGGNNQTPAPNILFTLQGSVIIQGTAPPGCTVELFASPTMDGQGYHYLGSVVAEPVGAYTLALGYLPYPYLTATATDPTHGTSEFSAVFTSTVFLNLLPVVLR